MLGKQNVAISNLFLERSNFIVIGLTGRTGSGCTTAANILQSKNPQLPSLKDLRYKGNVFYNDLDCYRYEILRRYAENNWNSFISIKVSDLISAYLLMLSRQDLVKFILDNTPEEGVSESRVKRVVSNGVCVSFFAKKMKKALPELLDEYESLKSGPKSKTGVLRVLVGFKNFTELFKKELDSLQSGLYVKVYQAAGNSIRKIGKVKPGYKELSFDPEKVFHLPKTINKVIKAVRGVYDSAFIVIDAIRNPYEARFFKDRYSAFYLVSVNAPDEDRAEYLGRVRKFGVDEIKSIDKVESGKAEIKNSDFVAQNVKKCIEMSDVHLFNPRNELHNNNILKSQLAWYVSLMIHPGLVSPTSMERVMQIAYTAKTNSGCISRQVGAVVTDKDNSIKAVGWNDVPKGQVPCSLRSLDGLLESFDDEVYSVYERTNPDFREKALEVRSSFSSSDDLKGRNLSYCFKDIKNSIDNKENQVHTRSLHAEENAFLQISKYGGMGVAGGSLYSTASPCELCAKKAFQLGISEIVFIDPYPGITTDHVLANGVDRPFLIQFRGAVGKGYYQLYEQALAYKDELEYFDNGEWLRSVKREKISSSLDLLVKEGVISKEDRDGFETHYANGLKDCSE